MKKIKINYLAPSCSSYLCAPRKTLMLSTLSAENGALSSDDGAWGSNSGESMGTEEGQW